MLATLSSYVRYLQMKTSTEQHRAAQIAAEEKFDEIRSFISRVRLGTAKDANGATVPLNSNPLDSCDPRTKRFTNVDRNLLKLLFGKLRNFDLGFWRTHLL